MLQNQFFPIKTFSFFFLAKIGILSMEILKTNRSLYSSAHIIGCNRSRKDEFDKSGELLLFLYLRGKKPACNF